MEEKTDKALILDEFLPYKLAVLSHSVSSLVARVYDKFYRVDATNTAISGTGLGMTIVKHLVEAQKGKVSILSSKRIGTTVIIELPLVSELTEIDD